MRKLYTAATMLVACLAGAVAHAQADFQPGYIVRPAGDTVRGMVVLRGDLRNTSGCRFQASATALATDFAPAQLRAYGVKNRAEFVARPVPAADSAGIERVLFVQVLASGSASLYTCRDQPGHTRYFVARGAGRLRELAEQHIKSFSNGLDAYQTRALYRDTLAVALAGCPAVQVQLPTLPYQRAALVRVVARYNECVGDAAFPGRVAAVAPAGHGPVLSVLAGYQYAALKPSGNPFFGVTPALHRSSFTGGLGLSVVAPHTRRTITLRFEAQYAHELFEAGSITPVATAASPATQTNTYRFDLQYLHVPVLLRYTLRRSPWLQPFLEAGGMYSRLLKAQNAFTQTYSFSSYYTAELPYFQGDNLLYNQFGLVAGAGASIPIAGERRLGVLVRYATSIGLSNDVNLDAPARYFSLLLSADLTKP